MPKEFKELRHFNVGNVGNLSETDIPDEAASYSVNIDADSEVGALTSIKGDYVLGNKGWQMQKKAEWYLRVADDVGNAITEEWFYLFALDRTYYVWFKGSGDAFPVADANLVEGMTEVAVDWTGTTSSKIANFVSSLSSLATPTWLKNTSGEQYYFTATSSLQEESPSDYIIKIASNILGNVPSPYTDSSATGGIATTDISFPQSSPTIDSSQEHVVNGAGFYDSDNPGEKKFIFLKSLIKQGQVSDSSNSIQSDSDIFGITSSKEAYLIENNGDSAFSQFIGVVSTSQDRGNFSAEQRNKNLYIGAGSGSGDDSLWFGKIDRTQVDRTLDGNYLLPNKLATPTSETFGSANFDNVVVPTFSSSMVGTNGGIMGHASLWGDGSGPTAGVFGGTEMRYTSSGFTPTSSDCTRSINGWIARCLYNGTREANQIDTTFSITADNFDDFQLGMICRVSIGIRSSLNQEGLDFSVNETTGDITGNITSYLRAVKQFAVGTFDSDNPSEDLGSTPPHGGEGQELHSGDLFQIVHIPSSATTFSATYKDPATATDIIRLAYVGCLFSKEGTSKSYDDDCHTGFSANVFGHYNDDVNLYRLKTSGLGDDRLVTQPSDVMYDSLSNQIDYNKYRFDSINLSEICGQTGRGISTMAECKSTDGIGGEGGREIAHKHDAGGKDAVGIASIAISSNVATVTAKRVSDSAAVPHSLKIGDVVTISGADTTVNGEQIITGVLSATTYTFANTQDDDAELTTSGTYTSATKNYHMGYGKLWVSFKGNVNSLFLVDITNWDNIDKDRLKITFKEITLNYSRIHPKLISDQDGEGLLEEPLFDTGWINDTWGPKPSGASIVSICETYSTYEHIGDGAGFTSSCTTTSGSKALRYNSGVGTALVAKGMIVSGVGIKPGTVIESIDGTDAQMNMAATASSTIAVKFTGGSGHGKWRTWLMMGHDSESSFVQWDLFLYNFRINIDDINTTNNQAYLYDKTPPYQECADVQVYADGPDPHMRFARDKASMCDDLSGTGSNYELSYDALMYYDTLYDCSEIFGQHYAAQEERTTQGVGHGNNSGNDVHWMILRDPEGWWHGWRAGHDSYRQGGVNAKPMATGGNGWCAESPRNFAPFKHCLKPTFFNWYKTVVYEYPDNQPSSQTLTIDNEVTGVRNETSHQVSFFGKLSGDFVIKSGYIYNDQGRWDEGSEANIRPYDNDITMFNMHDSPVGFTSDGETWDNQEIQGRPHETSENLSDVVEAGLRTERSVPATLGYSKYNQYRYGHAKNGLYLRSDDTPSNSNAYKSWTSYIGADGYGEYNMVTLTWASNVEDTYYSFEGDNLKPFGNDSETDYNMRVRIFGYGTDQKQAYDGNCQGSSDLDYKCSYAGKFGTGYLTYCQDDTAGNASSSVPYRFMSSYHNDNSLSGLTGTSWDNRRTVMCHHSTALGTWTDSGGVGDDHDNNFTLNARCTFHKLDMGKGVDSADWELENIKSVDNIIYDSYTPYGDDLEKTVYSGYIITGVVSGGDDLNNSTQTTLACVIGPKKDWNYEFYSTKTLYEQRAKNAVSHAACRQIHPYTRPRDSDGAGDLKEQRVTYTNNSFMLKNLIPGMVYEWEASVDDDFLNVGTYSPIMIGSDGTNQNNVTSIWARPQFSLGSGGYHGMGSWPCYKFDSLYNPHANDPLVGGNGTAFGFGRGFDKAGEADPLDRYPAEGIGSTAGVNRARTAVNPTETAASTGVHSKRQVRNLFTFTEVAVIAGESTEFAAGALPTYKITLLYDGFQESPLAQFFARPTVAATEDLSGYSIKLTLASFFANGISERGTHLVIYRKNTPEELYRMVKQIPFTSSKWSIDSNGDLIHQFSDNNTTATYEGINGVSETLRDFTPNYRLSCQLNDFLFVAGINHPSIEEGDFVMLRSKPGKFSIFDWSSDFMILPTSPVAIASFAGKIWLWDNHNMYKINAEGMYIEDKVEGIGILNNDSFVVTDYGMVFSDANNIYLHNGTQAMNIGDPILENHAHPEWQVGYRKAVQKAMYHGYTPMVTYDGRHHTFYIVLQGYQEGILSYTQYGTRAFAYSLKNKRWDFLECPSNIASVIQTGNGEVVLSDGYQFYNFRRDKRNGKNWKWESKFMTFGSSNYDKRFNKIKFTGSPCLDTFNSGANDVASSSDDLRVYIDGQLQTMRIERRNYVLGGNIGNDTSGTMYSVSDALPYPGHYVRYVQGTDIYPKVSTADTFTLNRYTVPELMGPPNSQYTSEPTEGEVTGLVHIKKGMYLLFEAEDPETGILSSEIVRVKNVKINYINDPTSSDEGKLSTWNLASHNQTDEPQSNYPQWEAVEIECYRGQLGTTAKDYFNLTPKPLRHVAPSLKFPSGAKGKVLKLEFENQGGYIDSLGVIFRRKQVK